MIGGPFGDSGLTGRKIIVDTYGGMARHGGGAFSGKDPTKVDRSAAYAARWVAKNVVAAGLAKRCELNLAYAIGVARPLSLPVETFGTETVPRREIERASPRPSTCARPRSARDLRPAAADLRATAAYGHFGRRRAADFTWERTDKAETLRRQAGLSGRVSAGTPTWASGRRPGTRGRRCCPRRPPCRPRASPGSARTG